MQYPNAPANDHVDTYFSTAVPDPFRPLEDLDSPETRAWIEAENALTQSYLAPLGLRALLLARLEDLTNYERYSAPTRYGTRYVYAHNSGLQNQSPVYWTEGLHGDPKLLLDPNTLAADGTVALSGLSITEDGQLAAIALSEAGSDWKRISVRNITTGEDLPDLIQWTKFSSPAWLPDGTGFYYTGYDAPPDGDPLKAVNHFPKVFFHQLGTHQSQDKLVFHRPDDAEIFLHAGITDDGRYLVITQHKGTSPNNQLALLDLTTEEAEPQQLIPQADASYSIIGNAGTKLWLYTTLNAPNGKVISIDLETSTPSHPSRNLGDLSVLPSANSAHQSLGNPADWPTIIPETTSTLESVSLVHQTLICGYLRDAHSVIELHREDGTHIQTLALPGIGSAGGFGGRRDDTETFYTFTNFTTPGIIYRLDLAALLDQHAVSDRHPERSEEPALSLPKGPASPSTPFREPKLLFNPQDFTTEEVFVTSKDGTKVPLFLTYKKGLKKDSQNPTILYGYGGFNVSLTPAFSSSNIAWLERGGIYAQACLRGGGEYGEQWHQAGTKLNKQNVFDDFIACAEWLIAQRYTSTAKLAIQGGSNGGLLVGACITQRPDLFGAANAAVGVMDMLRFDQFTVGWGWKQDYGSPSENEDEFRAILAYSPLHNLKPGTRYPATLITTADHDDRVYPAHSFKFTAAMQAAQHKDGPPILIRIETRAGHGAGMPIRKRLELTADTYSFFLHELKCD